MTLDLWVANRPYLKPIARVEGEIDREVARIVLKSALSPCWDAYLADYLAGVPLLRSEAAAIDLAPVEQAVSLLAVRLASKQVEVPEGARRPAPTITALIFPSITRISESPAMLRLLSWRLLSRYLRPVVDAFGSWRQEERWLRHFCPVCGLPPAMAQLIGIEPGRLRFLACGCCGTRWRYRRTGCPFCRDPDDHRLAAVAVENQGGLRIDYCERCRGYLKTYDGQGNESVLLADWTSVQLDYLALDRGLKRLAASAYDL